MCPYFYLCLALVLTSFQNGALGQTSGDVAVLEAASCEDLREIFQTIQAEKRIVITNNMRCTRDNWPSAVYVANSTVVEGSKFGEGVPAIDWADSTNAIVVQQYASLTFQNILLMQDFVQLGGLRLSFATGDEGASVSLLGTGVGIRSCHQRIDSLIPVFEKIQRPSGLPGEQIIERRTPDTVYIQNVAFVPRRGDNSTWAICRCVYQCAVNSPFQEEFQSSLNLESLEPHCGTGGQSNGQAASEAGGPSGSTSNSTFAVIVALFTALCTTLVLIFLFVLVRVVVIPLMQKKKQRPTPKRSDTENPTPRKTSSIPKKSRRSRSRHTSSVSLLNSAVQLTDIELGVPLGKGAMSTVYKGYHNDKPLAVKVVDMEANETFCQEDDPIGIYFAQRLYHINVIETLLYQTHRMEDLYRPPAGADIHMLTATSFMETSLSSINEIRPTETFQYRTFHVMEFCNLGSLEKAMSDGLFHGQDEQPKLLVLLRSALDIAKGMRYLHAAKIIHGQLRPSNILLKGDATDARGFVCKVSDFGLLHLQERQQALELAQGRNIPYRAPETLRKGSTDAGSDVFSFGMILWSMLTGKIPFQGSEPAESVSTILEGTRPAIPPTAPRRYERLIKDCWHADTSARPPFANIIERLSKIISEVVRVPESPDQATPNHRRHRKSTFSSTDGDTVVHETGSVVTENMFDTVEIHDSNSFLSGSMSTTGSIPFWEQFQTNVTSPLSTKSDIVFPSFDPVSQSPPPRRGCNSWDAAASGPEEETIEEHTVKKERPNQGAIASKPSETVSLRYGIASDSVSSEVEDLSSDPSAPPQ